MDVLKITLNEDGRVSHFAPDFKVMRGAYGNILINIEVPKALLVDSVYEDNVNITGNNIRIAAIIRTATGRNLKTKKFELSYVKDFTRDGVEYRLYQRKCPKVFTMWETVSLIETATNGLLELVINVVNWSLDENGARIEESWPSQVVPVDVYAGEYLDEGEELENPSDFELLQSQVQDFHDKFTSDIQRASALKIYEQTFTYEYNDFVQDGKTIFRSLKSGNIGNALSDASWWQPLSYVTFEDLINSIKQHAENSATHEDIRNQIAGIIEGTIGINGSLKNAINALNDEDGLNIKSNYQKKEDDSLSTGDKSLVGAINEIKQNLEETRQGLENAITGAIIYQGQWNITNQLDYSGLNEFLPIKKGWRWECTGETTIIDNIEYEQGDFITFNQDVSEESTITSEMIDLTDNGTAIGGLSIADLPKFVNKIYINMANATSLAGVLTLPIVSSSNFVVDWGDGTTTEYIEVTTEISHTYTDTNFAGWVYIYGDWKGISIGKNESTDIKNLIMRVIYDKNITSIPVEAFYGCTLLQEADLPSTCLTINAYAFYNCTNMKILNLPKNISTINSNTFYGCRSIKEVYIPDSVQSINAYAFQGCSSLYSLRLSNNQYFDKIPSYCFSGIKVTELNIPDAVESLQTTNAFSANSRLKKVTIGSNLKYFGSNTFYNCTALKEINISTITPPSVSSSLSIPDSVEIINVPAVSLKAYKQKTNWADHANHIYPIGGNYSETITIPSTAWDSATNTATVEAVGSTTEARNVITWFTSSGGSQVENTYGLKCTAQGTMQLTFSCETIPTEDVEVSVSYMLTNY